ncbi:unnamed protein product [Owenia fusiformis]|uniref:Uncharacterized protein n=1 Tax=Owenia fusiformis TaxID=6347 RepID=A0A8J1XFL0_OWEFU|nr:unnamed protein product [Owenia fusiformis]
MEFSVKLRIKDINPHIVCSLCSGYFVDATTITECLHTFCKSCIVKYLQSSKFCPQCNVKIHETHPLSNLKPDNVMQDIVYKLVPQLFESESHRREEFAKARGLIKQEPKECERGEALLRSVYDDYQGHLYTNDEQISLCLERLRPVVEEVPDTYKIETLPKKFLRCPSRARVSHLRKLLNRKLGVPPGLQLNIMCNDENLEKDITLKQLWLMEWHEKAFPLLLVYNVVPG